MTKPYRVRLSLEATVPEDPTVEPFLKASVEFEIYCPKCGPFRHNLKKNGFDTNHSASPQLFFVSVIRFIFMRIHLVFLHNYPRLCLNELFQIFSRSD